MPVYKTDELFDLSRTIAAPLLEKAEYPWVVLDDIEEFIRSLGAALPKDIYDNPIEDVWVAKNVTIYPSAFVKGPCIIDEGAEVRHGAFIRGNAIVGKNAVVGNSTELKNVILFDGVQVPHFNYVGDSILGYKAHLGAGAVTSNVKSDKTHVVVHDGAQHCETGRKKLGAILGDGVEVGCNSVLNPGVVIGRNSSVYPTSCVRGVVPENSIYKTGGVIVQKNNK